MSAETDHKLEAAPTRRPRQPAAETDVVPERVVMQVAPARGLAVPVRRSGDPLGGTNVDARTARQLANPGAGTRLHEDVRRSMESAMRSDFSGVRIHNDDKAATLARKVSATAFTHGNDIYFSRGAYAPDSEHGQRLLAHELAHVGQRQRGADRPGPSGAPQIGHADDPLEHDAERTAGQVIESLRRQAHRVSGEAAQ